MTPYGDVQKIGALLGSPCSKDQKALVSILGPLLMEAATSGPKEGYAKDPLRPTRV